MSLVSHNCSNFMQRGSWAAHSYSTSWEISYFLWNSNFYCGAIWSCPEPDKSRANEQPISLTHITQK